MILEGVFIPPEFEGANGELPRSILISRKGVVGTQTFWNAYDTLVTASAREGVHFGLTGVYRPLSEQIKALEDRYTNIRPAFITGEIRVWNGKVWYKKPGKASVAPPGKSVHGYSLAGDFCMANGDSLTFDAIKWLQQRAPSFGWRQSIENEPWHWVLVNWALYEPMAPLSTIPEVSDMAPRIVIESDHPDPKPQHLITDSGFRMWITDGFQLQHILTVLHVLWGRPVTDQPIPLLTADIRALPKVPGTFDPT